MDPTPATTVHAEPADARVGRRPGVGRAALLIALAGLLLVAGASISPVSAAAHRPAPESTTNPSGSAGDERLLDSSTARTPLRVAPEAVVLVGVVAVCLTVGLILLAASRRRRVPESEAPPAPEVPDAPDHEELLARALTARTGDRWSGVADDRRPAWLRRLDPEPPLPPAYEPGAEDERR